MVDVRGREPLPKDASEIVYSKHSSEYILKSQALSGLAIGLGHVHIDFEDEYPQVPSRDDLRYSVNSLVFSGIMGEWIHDDDAIMDFDETQTATGDWFASNDDYYFIGRGRADGRYMHCEDTSHCDDIGENVHEDDAHYSDVDGDTYYHKDNMPSEVNSSSLSEYHHGPPSKDLSSFAKFRIGFEIEKNEVNGITNEVGASIGNYDLIARFETDSSCGYDGSTGVEAITHILPLSGVRSKRRKEVFKLMDKATNVINEACSVHCGGHITISVVGYKSVDLLEMLRGNVSILYALYRHRLKNSYCDRNKEMKPNHHGGSCVAQLKGGGLVEFRLPSRVMSVKQLKLRYDLMYVLVRGSVERKPFPYILNKATPIIKKMYEGREGKVSEIISLCKHFRKYLISDHVSEEIREFIDGTNNNEED